jgi:uncharacterized protein (TIGR00369 family)
VTEKLRSALVGGPPAIPLGRTLGFHVVSVERGEVVVEMETTAEHFNPFGTVHGGVLCTLADTAMGIAHASVVEEGEGSTTLELKINFLRPVREAKLRAVGKLIKEGKTISLLECDVFDEKNRLVARCSSTYMTLRGEQADGRRVGQ